VARALPCPGTPRPQLRETAIELQLAPVRSSVHIPVPTLKGSRHATPLRATSFTLRVTSVSLCTRAAQPGDHRPATGRTRRRSAPTPSQPRGRPGGCGCRVAARVGPPIDRARAPSPGRAAAGSRRHAVFRRAPARSARGSHRPRPRTRRGRSRSRAPSCGARRRRSCRAAIRSKMDSSPSGRGSREILVRPHVGHPCQGSLQRRRAVPEKGLHEDLSMLRLGGAVVLGRSPSKGDDDLARQVPYDELRHCYQR